DLVGLQALQHLVHHLARAELAGPHREVEVLRLLEAEVSDDLGEDRRALELPIRKVLRLQRLVERLTSLGLRLAFRLALEPLPDLVAGARGSRDRHPVT